MATEIELSKDELESELWKALEKMRKHRFIAKKYEEDVHRISGKLDSIEPTNNDRHER